ncbi:MAG TPA: saccharopine dehydrogenase C-terminal domain-containing protein [Longimicrobiales bacterium]|nr:saccharopine dehydrogenase C-terminal domain-containing protein [Longimicrobiales bacterium]
MRMLVMGAGLQGSACAYDLLQNPEVEQVTVADMRIDSLPPFLERYRKDERLRLVRVDARNEEEVRGVMAGATACMNALPYYFNLDITRIAVEAGVHYCDLGGNTAIVFDQMKLDDDAKQKNISVIPDCGLAPGMVNILAAAGIAELDEPETVRIRVGGLPQDPQPPLNYQIVYSLHGVLDYYTTDSWVLRDGEPLEVDALSEVEPVEFPAPVGTLEAFHTAGGLSTMPWTYKDRLRNMEYKTLRYPGHADAVRVIRDLGLLSLDPVEVSGGSVVPRDVFIACAEPRLRRPEARDLVALRVEAEGKKDGRPRRIVFDLIDYHDEKTGITAMERTTGFSLSITGQMQARGQVKPGVLTPDLAVPAQAYIDELKNRNIDIRRHEA